MNQEMLTLEEAARLAGLTSARIRQILRGGGLVGVKRASSWFVTPDSVRALIERRAVGKKGATKP